MLFTSIQFMLFFPLVAMLYYALPSQHRWKLLLAASYYFYMSWKPIYAVLILLSTLVDYYAALGMQKSSSLGARRRLLALSLTTNLGLLLAFKYLDFSLGSIETLLRQAGILIELPAFDLLLPIGISFYTFQTLSYSIDVYRGEREPERHFGYFALFVSFFPQLVAGPIERSHRLLPQLRKRHSLRAHEVLAGLRTIAWGIAKKVVVADRLALIVDPVFATPQEHDGMVLAIATIAFAFQIYYDFSAYSDIAIGAARVLGIRLMQNFNRPYAATSLTDFWRRWHISLSQWFRDYVYIPLGGSRKSTWLVFRNLLIVFAVSGLWHGASWTFVVWGCLHGGYLCLDRSTEKLRARMSEITGLARIPRLRNALAVTVTFSLVCFAWIFFRANSLEDALYICTHLGSGWALTAGASGPALADLVGTDTVEFGIVIGFLLTLELVQWAGAARGLLGRLYQGNRRLRWLLYELLILAIFLFGVTDGPQFIYFQF